MSVRYFPGQPWDPSRKNGYESSFPGGVALRWGQAINAPIARNRRGEPLRRVEVVNAAADMQYSLAMAPVADPEYAAKTAQFTDNYTSSPVPRGTRWWNAGGLRPIQPVLQHPDDPLPPLVYDN
jgi:hypothetical protein